MRRSRSPFPARTVIWCAPKSTSLTRNRSASSNRIPVPYSSSSTSITGPPRGSWANSCRTSSRVNTTGTRPDRFARTSVLSQPTGMISTSRYRKMIAASA